VFIGLRMGKIKDEGGGTLDTTVYEVLSSILDPEKDDLS